MDSYAERKWVCDTCDKRFLQKGHLTGHDIAVHQGRKDWACPHCDMCFGLKESMVRHRRVKHEGRRAWMCSEPRCGMTFTANASVKQHVKTVHEGIRDAKCETCGKFFTNRGIRDAHIESVHEKRRDFGCEVNGCDKAFFTRALMLNHKSVVHDGLRPHACPVDGCVKKFGARRNLKDHRMYVHEKRRDWKCKEDGCGKAFSHQKHLVTHLVKCVRRRQVEAAKAAAKAVKEARKRQRIFGDGDSEGVRRGQGRPRTATVLPEAMMREALEAQLLSVVLHGKGAEDINWSQVRGHVLPAQSPSVLTPDVQDPSVRTPVQTLPVQPPRYYSRLSVQTPIASDDRIAGSREGEAMQLPAVTATELAEVLSLGSVGSASDEGDDVEVEVPGLVGSAGVAAKELRFVSQAVNAARKDDGTLRVENVIAELSEGSVGGAMPLEMSRIIAGLLDMSAKGTLFSADIIHPHR